MKSVKFSWMLLLLLGLSIQPCLSNSPKQAAIEHVAKLSEAEMREELPRAKESARKHKALMNKNYHHYVEGTGIDLGEVDTESYKAGYEFYSTVVIEIEKRLHIIDSKREQEQKKQLEKTQKQQGQKGQNIDEQRQAELTESYNKALEGSKEEFNIYHDNVNDKVRRATDGNVPQDILSRNDKTGYTSTVPDPDVWDTQKQSSTNNFNNTITNLFNNNKFEELKKQQEKTEVQNKKSDEDIEKRRKELLRRTEELRKLIDELPIEE